MLTELKESIRQTKLGPTLVRTQLAFRSLVDKVPMSSVYSAIPNVQLRSTPDLVFIWIPKNSGSAVFRELNQKLGMQRVHRPNRFRSMPKQGAITPAHVSWVSLRGAGLVDKAFDDRAFKFAIARNPYSRIVSLFNYSRRYGFTSAPTFKDFLDEIESNPQPIGLFNQVGLSQANLQLSWITNPDGSLLVDKVYRFEDLQSMAKDLSARFAKKIEFERQVNRSPKLFTVNDLHADHASLSRVNHMYAPDFEAFDYGMKT